MSIGSELSYDVVEAVLSREKENNSTDAKVLLDVLMNFHEALQPLVKQSRKSRRLGEKETIEVARSGVSNISH